MEKKNIIEYFAITETIEEYNGYFFSLSGGSKSRRFAFDNVDFTVIRENR
jgi:hypothetical protein